jgi:hypothetical protein
MESKLAKVEGARLTELKSKDATVAKLYKNGIDNFSSTTKQKGVFNIRRDKFIGFTDYIFSSGDLMIRNTGERAKQIAQIK